MLRLDLNPLSASESRALIAAVLQAESVADRPWRRIVDVAGGNPLYVQELVSMLTQEGRVRRQGETWAPSTDPGDMSLPRTLQAVLVARLDGLPAGERRLVDVAAVMGADFDRRALAALAGQRPEDVAEGIARLVDKGILRTEASRSENTIAFGHALIREATYNCLSKATRADLHERFADWLNANQDVSHAAEQDEVLGYHLERACRYVRDLRPAGDEGPALASRAREHLAAAGRKAFTRGDMVAAANLLGRAVTLFDADDPSRLAILPSLSEALMMTGDLERAGSTLDEALSVAQHRDDRAVQAHVGLVQTTQRLFTQPEGWVDLARQQVEAAIPVFEELQDHQGLARSWRLLSLIDLSICQFSAAGEAMDRSATFARRAGDRREELESLSWLPLPLFVGPERADRGLDRCQEIVQRAGGDRKVEGTVLLIRASLEAMLDDVAEARRTLARAKLVFEDLGLLFWLAGPVSQLAGWVELTAGDPAAAERELQSGYEILRQMGESNWLSTVAGFLARAHFAQGRLDEAGELADYAMSTAGSQDVYSQVVGRGVKAKVLARQGSARAEAVAREALRLVEGTDCLPLQADAWLDLADVCPADEAAASIRRALRLHERKGNVLGARDARARLERLASVQPAP